MAVPTMSPNNVMLATLVVVVPASDCRQETNRQISPSVVEFAANKHSASMAAVLGCTPLAGTDRIPPW